MEILAVAGNNQLGGKDFNEAIYKAFLADNGLNDDVLTPSERASIYKMAENCKIALTDTPICVMSVNIGDEKFTLTLDNNTLIKIGHEVFREDRRTYQESSSRQSCKHTGDQGYHPRRRFMQDAYSSCIYRETHGKSTLH